MIALLEWLARAATPLFALGVFAGLAAPDLAAFMRPALPIGVALPFYAALAAADGDALKRAWGRPALLATTMMWTSLGGALATIATLALLPPLDPSLGPILILTAACPPIMAMPAIAAILGLDAAFALLATVLASALAPFWLPVAAATFAPVDFAIAPSALALRLAALAFGCMAAAHLTRKTLGQARIEALRPAFRGLAVLGLLIFAIAVMDGARDAFARDPAFVLERFLAAWAFAIGLQALTALLFWRWCGARRALTIALLAGNNNIGLVLAALAGGAPFALLSYVAMAQFPIYLLPILQRRLYEPWSEP